MYLVLTCVRGPNNRAMHQSAETHARPENTFDVSDYKNNNFLFFFFSIRFTYVFFIFRRRPRRINYNRDQVKSSLGELFIDPACPNTRARARARRTRIKIWLCVCRAAVLSLVYCVYVGNIFIFFFFTYLYTRMGILLFLQIERYRKIVVFGIFHSACGQVR